MNNKKIQIKPPCGEKAYYALCGKYTVNAKFCDTAKNSMSGRTDWHKVLWGKTNCVDLFAVKEDLLKKESFKFKATSWCMFPVMQKGDDIKVESTPIDKMNVGDIPVYRDGDKLFSHRVVGKKNVNGKKYIITRPDGADAQDDPGKGDAIAEEEILGKVREIRRYGKSCSQAKRQPSLLDKLSFKKHKFYGKARDITEKTLFKIQSVKIYQKFASFIINRFIKDMRIQFVTPMSINLGILRYTDTDKTTAEDIRGSRCFYTLLKIKKMPVAAAVFINKPGACPYEGVWLGDVFVRRAFRQSGAGRILMKKTKKALTKIGMDNIKREKRS